MFRFAVFLIAVVSLFFSQFGIRMVSFSEQEMAASFFLEEELDKSETEKNKTDFKSKTGKLAEGILKQPVLIPIFVPVRSHDFWHEEELQSVFLSLIHRPPQQFA